MYPSIYVLELPPPDEAAVFMKRYKAFASPYRLEIASRLRFSEDRARSLFGEALVKLVLSKILARSPLEIVLVPDERGKPRVEKPDKAPYFNISHSGSYVTAIFDASPVGVDIERTDRFDHDAEASRFQFMNPRELQEYGAERDAETRRLHYYGIWTIKESIVKSSGTGLYTDPVLIDAALPPAPFQGSANPWSYRAAEDRTTGLVRIDPSHLLGWCLEGRRLPEIERVRFAALDTFYRGMEKEFSRYW